MQRREHEMALGARPHRFQRAMPMSMAQRLRVSRLGSCRGECSTSEVMRQLSRTPPRAMLPVHPRSVRPIRGHRITQTSPSGRAGMIALHSTATHELKPTPLPR